MSDLPPPVVAPKKSSFPTWIFGCCGGCLLLVLLVAGTIFFSVQHVVSRLEQGATAETQDRTYGDLVTNLGPPPGYRILLGTSLFSFPFVVFVPEDVPGSLEQIRESNPSSLAILYRMQEGESERAARGKLFTTGRTSGAPSFLRMLLPPEVQSQLDPPVLRVGTILGHRYPIHYAAGKMEGGRRRRVTVEIAYIDLTPPGTKGSAVQAVLLRMDGQEITEDFLTRFCENFRPGE
ncbi:MAG: hypothetical protein JNJ88_20310 [Planctomycetes bacterium]|nr:hypothetical protein [Planctomycetota bacterium]